MVGEGRERGGGGSARGCGGENKRSTTTPTHPPSLLAQVRLEPGERRELSFALPPRAFAFWDAAAGQWLVEPGDFDLLVGASATDIRLTGTVRVRGEAHAPPVERVYRHSIA